MTTLLLVIGISLAVSFFCSLLEAVLLSVSHSYVAALQERGDPIGDLLKRLRSRIDEPIAAILTLNTIAHTAGAAVGGAVAYEHFGSAWIALFAGGLTLAILVLSEILPKTLGTTFWQELAPASARVLGWLIFLMKPILIPLALINRLLTPARPPGTTVSRAELEVLAAIGRRAGTIDQEEWEVMTNVMNLDEVSVGQVMTPRTQMVSIPITATLDDAQRMILAEGHHRIPVYEDNVDHIVGILLARDVWRAADAGVAELRDVVRPPTFVPESKPVEDLIREMRGRRLKMAVVLDEYGGTAGLVTLEDLIEEIVGDIQDEHEMEPLSFEEELEGEVRVGGSVPVCEVNERFGITLPEDHFDTVGGYVFGALGRVGAVGDEVIVPGGLLRIVEMDGRRIERLAFIPEPAFDPAAEQG